MSGIHLWIDAVFVFLDKVTSLKMFSFFFLVSCIYFKFKDCHFFNHWVVVYCVNASYILYSIFGWGLSKFFAGSGCYENHWANALVLWKWFCWIYTQSDISGSLDRLIPNFLINHHLDFYNDCPSIYSYQQWRSIFPYSTPSPASVINVFGLNHSGQCRMVGQSSFDLCFADD